MSGKSATLYSTKSTVDANALITSKLVCAWFVRKKFVNVHGNSLQFPIAIISIIVQYFLMEAFEWNSEKSNDAITFTLDNTSAVSKSDLTHRICTSKNVIDSEIYSYIEWETTLKFMKTGSIYFGMGFVEHSLCESVEDWSKQSWIGGNGFAVGQTSVTLYYGFDEICIYINGKKSIVKHENALLNNIKNGDRFELRFDLDAHRCSFYLNDKFMKVVTDCLEKRTLLVPAACFAAEHELQTTKWNVVFKNANH